MMFELTPAPLETLIDEWLFRCLENMFGNADAGCYFDNHRGALGCYVVQWGSERGTVSHMTVVDKRPRELLSCFRCDGCGAPIRDSLHRYRVSVRSGHSSICNGCVELADQPRLISLRDIALDSGSDVWAPGALGLRDAGSVRDTLVHPDHQAKSSGALKSGWQ